MTSLSSKQAPRWTVGNSLVPAEGPKSITLNLNFALDNSGFSVEARNLLTDFAAQFCMLQTIYVDTSGTDSPVTVKVLKTNQQLIVKGRTQGFYGIVAPNDWTLEFTCADANAAVNVQLLNYAVAGHAWATQ